jgi:hypothetical protein
MGCGKGPRHEDVQKLFPDSVAVNAALRALGQVVAATQRPSRPKVVARKRAAV